MASTKTGTTERVHYKDWPNTGAFNSPGDLREKIALPTKGTFPDYVSGTLYRTGPGFYKIPRKASKSGEMACSHWFDGFTTVHKFEIDAVATGVSEVHYQSYCQVDDLVEQARKTGRLSGVSFGQKRDPCDTLFKKMKTAFESTALTQNKLNANIGVAFREVLPSEAARIKSLPGSRILGITTDNAGSKQFDMDTLEPLGLSDQSSLHPSLKGPLSGAHAAHDPETGDIFNYNLDLGPVPSYKIFKASLHEQKVEILAEISGRDIHAAYIHSMSITKNFLILAIWPAFYAGRGISILWNRSLMDSIAPFDTSAKTIWIVVDRRHGRGVVKKFTSPGFFTFHTTNAWEETSQYNADTIDIVCELVEFPNLDILHKFYYDNLVSDGPGVAAFSTRELGAVPSLTRYKLSGIPFKSTQVARGSSNATEAVRIMKIPAPSAGELPRINPAKATKPHRYVWGVSDRGKSSFVDGLIKTDTKTQSAIFWEKEKHTPGEPIFIAAPDGTNEDEGVVLSVVLDGVNGTSYLLCLNAETMEEVARAEVPTSIGMGFHGLHLPKTTTT